MLNKKFFLIHRRALFIATACLLFLSFIIYFLSLRPWRLASSLRALQILEASYNRSFPCHESCLVERLQAEAALLAAWQKKQPGLKEALEEKLSDELASPVFRRALQRIMDE